MLMTEPLGLLRAIREHALALVAERQIHGGGNLLADGGVSFNLFADRFDRGMRPKEPVGEGFVLAQQAQQEVLRLDIGTSELAGLVPCEEDYPACLFGVSF